MGSSRHLHSSRIKANMIVAAGGLGLLLIIIVIGVFNSEKTGSSAPVNTEVIDQQNQIGELKSGQFEARGLNSENVTQDDSVNKNVTREAAKSFISAAATANLKFELSISAEEVLDQIARYRSEGEKASADLLEQQLNQLCGMLQMSAYPQDIVDVKMTYGQEKLKKYCNGYPYGTEDLNAIQNGLESARSAFSDKLTEKMGNNLEPGKFDRALLELIVDASSPLEIDTIQAEIDAYRETGGEELVSLVGSDSLMMGNAALNWGDALTIYSCQKFGNCHTRSPRFLFYCFILKNDCARYSNVLDFLYDRLSPIEVQRVNVLLGEINKFEAGRKRSG